MKWIMLSLPVWSMRYSDDAGHSLRNPLFWPISACTRTAGRTPGEIPGWVSYRLPGVYVGLGAAAVANYPRNLGSADLEKLNRDEERCPGPQPNLRKGDDKNDLDSSRLLSFLRHKALRRSHGQLRSHLEN